MSDKVPNVVYKQEFFLPNYKDKTNQDKRNYYSSNKYDDYLKYVATGIKDLEKLDFVEYSNNSTKSSGIFNQNGLMSKEQIADFRKDLRATKSVIWSGIISFEETFGKKWCGCYEQAYELVKTNYQNISNELDLIPTTLNGLLDCTRTQIIGIFICCF